MYFVVFEVCDYSSLETIVFCLLLITITQCFIIDYNIPVEIIPAELPVWQLCINCLLLLLFFIRVL